MAIRERQSALCVGLDPNPDQLPDHLPRDAEGIWQFNCAIIEATAPYCVAYKLNTAFYEALGLPGWQCLDRTVRHLALNYPQHFRIADAKRGDIGNTSKRYAQAFFEAMPFHALTVAPYMGHDSLQPFFDYPNRWLVVLGLTSNPGAEDFQLQALANGKGQFLYERVMAEVASWAPLDQVMFVVGATRQEQLAAIRQQYPDHFFLVPGVGAQGGDLKLVMQLGQAREGGGLLINSSRGIIYRSRTPDFAASAAMAARELQNQMAPLLR